MDGESIDSESAPDFPKVELHIHLDGAVRPETIWDISREKGVSLGDDIKSLNDLKKSLVITEASTLHNFLQPFNIYMPLLMEDYKSMERIAYELCEDEAARGVVYFEARYSPHFFLKNESWSHNLEGLRNVVDAINRGFRKGENDFNIKVRTILCSLIGLDLMAETFKLAEAYRLDGVVGIDTAACCNLSSFEEVPLSSQELQFYDKARQLGIHRTMHAGESGGPEMVKRAVQDYYAERIGHGYSVVDDDDVFVDCVTRGIHFETCPKSSTLTGAVLFHTEKHPIVIFAESNANFSISSDDPTETGCYLDGDYELARSWGLSDEVLAKSNLNAARSCFLPENEKTQLLRRLERCYGLAECSQ